MLRIGNASGFYGDRFSAFRELLEGGPVDVITGDYLAELTMLILGRDRMKDPSLGYAKTFLKQMQDCAQLIAEKKTKIVVNAGGLNPAGLAHALQPVLAGLKIAHIEGDDLLARADELGFGSPLTANAYLGGWGIAACLDAGADVVVTGRVTDASLVVGAAASHFKWKRDEWNKLAGAMVAGHVLECGPQATGGNFSFFTELSLKRPGFPIAEMESDGSSVITKHANTDGAVTIDTVTAQLVYEITGARYAGPDATARFDTVQLEQQGKDRVRISGVQGEPPPPTYKVSLNHFAGFRNSATFLLVGLDIDAKAKLAREQLESALKKKPAHMEWFLARTDREDPASEEEATATLRVVVKDMDQSIVGRAFSSAGVEMALSSYPGFFMNAPPGDASPYGIYKPGYVPAFAHTAVLPDGARIQIEPTSQTLALAEVPAPAVAVWSGNTTRGPLGRLVAARSGDKGGSANVGVWTRSLDHWPWLATTLTVEKFKALLPETRSLKVERHVFANLHALNFVVEGILGEGVASSTRFDPQAKALGEWLRARFVDLPE